MRSLVLSLIVVAAAAAPAAAQRPSITRPIQQARAAAAKADARTEAAQAVVQEPSVRRDSVPVTTAPPTRPTLPTSSKPNGSAASKGTAPSTAKPADSTRSATAAPAPTGPKAPAGTTPPPAPNTPAGRNTPAGTSTPAPVPTVSAEKGTTSVPPQVAPGKGAPAGTKAPVAPGVAAKPIDADSRSDSTAATMSVGSMAMRTELRIDREVFAYDAGGRRDPFVSLFSTSDLRPLFSDLLLVVINYDPQRRNSVAIMRDATTKEQYRVRQGQLIGRMRVSAIEQKRVLFTIDEFGFSRQESLVIGDTTKVRKQ
jgi:hypothetical protein